MITIKDAVKAAFAYISDAYSEQFVATTLSDLLLEEVEQSEDKKYWLITVSIKLPMQQAKFDLGLPRFEIKYKLIKVDSTTGNVVSMKIRELNEARNY